MRDHKYTDNIITQLRSEVAALRNDVRKLQNSQVTTVPIYDTAAYLTSDGVEGQVVVDTVSNPSQQKIKYRQNQTWYTLDPRRTIVLIIGDADTAGIKYDVEVGMDGTIVGWTLVADQTGSLVVDLWKNTYANFPPVVANSITGSTPPTISPFTLKAQSSVLTGWNTSITTGDILRINVNSSTTITRATLSLHVLTS